MTLDLDTFLSRISQCLAPGAYTIEATAYNAGANGDFNLSISVLGVPHLRRH